MEAIIAAVAFAAFTLVLGYWKASSDARYKLSRYKSALSQQFADVEILVRNTYGKEIDVVIPEHEDDEGNIVLEHTEKQIILENESVIASFDNFRKSLN